MSPGVNGMNCIRRGWLALLLCASCGVIAQETPGGPEARLIAVLTSGATEQQQSETCIALGRVGSAKAVPALAALLDHERLSHAARFALEQIRDPAADEALRAALGRLKGIQLVGAIDSLGVRRDPKAVESLAGFLNAGDATVVQASAQALGSIGTEDAAHALEATLAKAQGAQQIAVCDGLFRCAEALESQGHATRALAIYDAVRGLPQAPHQVHTAALRGAILLRKDEGLPLLIEALHASDRRTALAATRIAGEAQAPGVTKALADELEKLPADRQVLVIGVLGQRQDAVALPVLVALAKSGDPSVRVAAIKAAAEIGDPSLAGTLIDLLLDKDAGVAGAARAALAGLPGHQVDEEILKPRETPYQALMLDMMGQRRIAKAIPVLKGMLDAPDVKLQLAAIKSLGEVADQAELPGLLARLATCADAARIEAYEKVIRGIGAALQDPNAWVPALTDSLGRSTVEAKPALLRLLNVAGGTEALKAVHQALDDDNKDVHAAAIRVLCDWKSVDAAPLLLELAKQSAEPVDRILALRGYLALAMLPNASPESKLAICREAAALIQRPEEKRMLLAAVSSLAHPAALSLIVPYLNDDAVKQETVLAILAVAGKREKKQDAGETKAALESVIATASDKPDTVKQAKKLLSQIVSKE